MPGRAKETDWGQLSTAAPTGAIVWLTGLSGAGKSTLARGLCEKLREGGRASYVLDGDALRQRLNADLGFTPNDRRENVRRIGEVAAMFADAGLICITACISPLRADRQRAREAAGHIPFHEVYLAADLATCEARDPKGLYRKARSGLLADFTGIDAPYEFPLAPELTLDTGHDTADHSLMQLLDYVSRHLPD